MMPLVPLSPELAALVIKTATFHPGTQPRPPYEIEPATKPKKLGMLVDPNDPYGHHRRRGYLQGASDAAIAGVAGQFKEDPVDPTLSLPPAAIL